MVHPWSTGAAWSSHQVLCVVGAPGMPRSGCGGERASHYGWTVRDAEAWSMPRLVLRWGGLGRHEPQDCRGLGVQCRGLERAADHGYSVWTQWSVIPVVPFLSRYGAGRGHSGRAQWSVISVVSFPSRYGADRGHSGRAQWSVIPVTSFPSRYGADRGHSGRTQWPVPAGMALMRPRVASAILWR